MWSSVVVLYAIAHVLIIACEIPDFVTQMPLCEVPVFIYFWLL